MNYDNYYGYFRCPFLANASMYNPDSIYNYYNKHTLPCFAEVENINPDIPVKANIPLKDYGPDPFVVNIEEATLQNTNFRTALWTGKHLQLTLMSLRIGEEIGLEMHPDVDQFLRIEQGQGLVKMGSRRDSLDFQRNIFEDSAIFIPAGTWHNLINTGNKPLKLYSIYAPPNHPRGTVHVTRADAMAAEENGRR